MYFDVFHTSSSSSSAAAAAELTNGTGSPTYGLLFTVNL
jgi:hypothetical protein